MPWYLWLIAAVAALVVAAVTLMLLRPGWLTRGPRGEIRLTLFWYAARSFCRLLHRVRYIGLEHAPAANEPGGIIVVSNHTGGVDPLLIAAGVPFHIRWMMAAQTMSPSLLWLWRWLDVIPVQRRGRDMAAAREAIRHIRAGGSVGMFPEGGIEIPPGEIRPFLEGVGLVVMKSKAPVLLVWVSGTAFSENPFGSVIRPSRARVEFLGTFDYSQEIDPKRIAQQMREEIHRASGWPMNDAILPAARQPDDQEQAGPGEERSGREIE